MYMQHAAYVDIVRVMTNFLSEFSKHKESFGTRGGEGRYRHEKDNDVDIT
jgi:hypothetical protein